MTLALIRRRSPRPAVLTALVLALLAGFARPAAAQPGDGIPKPITSREINTFAERLGLTPMQRAAIDPIHDAYKADFAELQRRLIDPFTATQRQMNMGGPSVTREAVEEMLGDLERISTRVAALDARFFDQVAPLFTEQQVSLLPRIRMARERTLAQNNSMGMAFGGPAADLSAMLARSDARLTPAEAERVDAVLEPYERRLTRRLKDLDEAASSMMLRLVDAMDQAGFLGMTQEEMVADPARMQEMMQVVQQAFSDVSADAREEAGAIAELNLDTYARLMDTLPPQAAVALRGLFLRESVSIGLQVDTVGPCGPWLTALRTRDLSDADRATIQTRLAAAVDGENRLVDPLITAFVEARTNIDPMNMNMNQFQELQEQVPEVVQTLQARRADAEAEVAALLGDGWRDRLAAVDEDGAVVGGPMGMPGMAMPAAPGADAAADERAADRVTGDAFIPSRIGTRTLRRMADRIGIDELDRPILDTLHGSYRDAFVELPSLQRSREAWHARWDGSSDRTEVERAEAVNASRRAAMAEIAALEEQFFSDLQSTFGNDAERADAIERERLARHAERLLGSGQRRSFSARGGGQAGDVDLLELVRETDLADADRSTASTVLAGRLQDVIAVAERLYAARLDLELGEARWRTKLNEMDQGDPMAFQDVYQEAMGAPSERLESIRSELATMNRTNLEAVAAALSTDGRRTIEMAWQRRAYPSVYNDPMCVLPHYERALALEDLGATQREDLSATLATYRSEWERLSEGIVEKLASVNVDFSAWQEVDWATVQATEQELAALGLERSEQNVRAANQLRLVLREDQLARLGRLPDPDDERIPTIWGF